PLTTDHGQRTNYGSIKHSSTDEPVGGGFGLAGRALPASRRCCVPGRGATAGGGVGAEYDRAVSGSAAGRAVTRGGRRWCGRRQEHGGESAERDAGGRGQSTGRLHPPPGRLHQPQWTACLDGSCWFLGAATSPERTGAGQPRRRRLSGSPCV